ncbi:hypothetical protein J4E83_010365 [Alternaria metachromatica]|uniref:uncharacterized protein n=1 Tax=Alternaria metachromatica TaxID=283354 RepID=UPI0020C4D861|nr:uncharacterized protein J4E83_010365 [Alternaria metachromatica]KAI4605939.1 hypothetical protein J4E83_010365 [Alternaria metachromatica]
MAMACLQAILACFPCGTEEPEHTTYPDEKVALLSAATSNTHPTDEVTDEIADSVVEKLLTTRLTGAHLRMHLDALVGPSGWRTTLAQHILSRLTTALRASHEELGPTISSACDTAWEAAQSIEGFVIEHPVMCTVIALGVLAIVAPWVLEALGFAELGPVEGTFASWWQSTYAGLVPKNSLFSFFQRLGMTKWHWVLV